MTGIASRLDRTGRERNGSRMPLEGARKAVEALEGWLVGGGQPREQKVKIEPVRRGSASISIFGCVKYNHK
jgi:hypothetical protein